MIRVKQAVGRRGGLLALVLLALTPAGAAEVSRGEDYPGAFHLYLWSDVTVVYPGAPGEDVAVHRRSAQARARFLEATRGTKTRVVADVDVTEADRNTNLLVLGWGNRLLGSEAAPRPFSRSGDTLTLLGKVVGRADDDLVFYNRSPYNKDRFLLFWSRIDPESDRFMVLPRVGSDWAVYRQYKIVRQGMFVPGGAWPPAFEEAAQMNHEPAILLARGREAVRRSDHYAITHDPSQVDSESIDRIVRARERAFAKAVAALGDPGPSFRINLHVYGDEHEMTEMTGVDDPAHSVPRERELHMTRRLAEIAAAHEEYHLVAYARLGPAVLTGLYEGLAHALDGSYKGLELDLHAALLVDEGAWPSLAAILDEESFRALPDPVGPVTAGLFVEWLRSSFPADRFSETYRLVDGTPEALAAVVKVPASDLDAAFSAWGQRKAAARANDLAFLKAEREAADRLAASDYRGVARALERALTLRPEDPQTLFNLASARMRTDEFDRAAAGFRKLAAMPLGPAESRFRIFSHYQLGRILDIQNRREDALAEYRLVLELPDEYDAHRLARERMESPATREQLE